MAGLARHVDPDELIKSLRDRPSHQDSRRSNRAVSHTTPYSSRYASVTEIPKFRIPHDGAPADAVHQLLKDELDLDGVSRARFEHEAQLTKSRNQISTWPHLSGPTWSARGNS
jgi:hypothetical protein